MKKPIKKRIASKLDDLRNRVDRLDSQLIAILSRRAELAKKIGKIKRAHRLPAIDLKREKAILKRALTDARGFSKMQFKKILATILKESRKIVKP